MITKTFGEFIASVVLDSFLQNGLVGSGVFVDSEQKIIPMSIPISEAGKLVDKLLEQRENKRLTL